MATRRSARPEICRYKSHGLYSQCRVESTHRELTQTVDINESDGSLDASIAIESLLDHVHPLPLPNHIQPFYLVRVGSHRETLQDAYDVALS